METRGWRVLAASAVAALILCGPASAAKRPVAEQKKIDQLIDDVRQSGAIFIRNGSEYEAVKAVSHLKFKLMMAGSRVQTAKDFIEGVASHSEETKTPYRIRLPGSSKDQLLRDWLLAHLADHERTPRLSATPPAAKP